MKNIDVLKDELLRLQQRREEVRGLLLPSERDAAIAELDRMAGFVFGNGGLETMLMLAGAR